MKMKTNRWIPVSIFGAIILALALSFSHFTAVEARMTDATSVGTDSAAATSNEKNSGAFTRAGNAGRTEISALEVDDNPQFKQFEKASVQTELSDNDTPLIAISNPLPEGEVKNPYPAQTLTVVKGVAPYKWTWKADPGSTLPAGLALKSGSNGLTAVIAGQPQKAGTFNFTVTVKDHNQLSGLRSFSILVEPALIIKLKETSATLTRLPGADNNSAYSCLLAASGGKSPYIWTPGPDFPTWLALDSNTGALSGMPTLEGNIARVNIVVTDSLGYSLIKSPSLKVNKTLAITTTGLPGADIAVKYQTTLKATGGKTPYSWSIVDGQLPSGLSLSVKGLISGAPDNQASGAYGLTLQVSDGIATVTKPLFITLNPALAMGDLPDGNLNMLYHQSLSGLTTGGSWTGYKFAVMGKLPAGLKFNAAKGLISGTPQGSPGSYTVNIKVSDSLKGSLKQEMSFKIKAFSPAYNFVKSLQNNQTGLVKSWEVDNNTKLYQNALAAMAYIHAGDSRLAEKIFNFYQNYNSDNLTTNFSGFRQWWDASTGQPLADVAADNFSNTYWEGDNAFLLLSLNYYSTVTGNTARYSQLSAGLKNWLATIGNSENIWEARELHAEGLADMYAALLPYRNESAMIDSALNHLKAGFFKDYQGENVLDHVNRAALVFGYVNDFSQSNLEANFQRTEGWQSQPELSVTAYAAFHHESFNNLEISAQILNAWKIWRQDLDLDLSGLSTELDKVWLVGAPGAQGLPYYLSYVPAGPNQHGWTHCYDQPMIVPTCYSLFADWKFNPFIPGRQLPTQVAAGEQILAVQCSACQGVQINPADVSFIDGGDWIEFNNVDFGGGGRTDFKANLCKGNDFGGILEIRLDSTSGPLIGQLTPHQTCDDWGTWQVQSTTISPVTGVHKIFLTFTGSSGVCNLQWFSFR
jgi:hypothetical protein